jgi:hypothetical protein
MRSTASLVAGVSLLAALANLGCEPQPSETKSVFVIPDTLDALSEETFFDHPWPSELRLENGAPRLRGYYNPKSVPIVAQYIEAMDGKLDGFSPTAAGFLRFSSPLDPASLPADPKAGLDPEASVQLIDIDPASPEHGQRKLVSLFFRETAGVYWLPNTLAFEPTLGFPLRPHTRYALVVTDAVRSADGSDIIPSDDLEEVLGITEGTSRTAAARQLFTSAINEVEKAGISRKKVVHFTSFVTADPTAELFQVADHVKKFVPAPTVDPDSWQHLEAKPTYDEYTGMYGPSPNFQAGKLPFSAYGDGGQFNFEAGAPSVVDLFDLRFSISIPKADKCPMPATGYPIVLFAHGTGGDFQSYVRDGSAREVSQRCMASMGVDQIFHGTRPGAPPPGSPDSSVEILFFNFENPVAARTNPRQGAIDEVQRARLFTDTHMTVPAGISVSGGDVHFDPNKVLYFGHSQGGLSGPLFLASSGATRGGVLSGSSAVFSIALLEKTKPDPSIKQLVATVFLNLNSEESAELNLFHPAISLAQSIVDVTDTLHYARFLSAEPRLGFSAKSIYMTEGINPDGVGDSYAPPHGIEAHGIAAGLPLQLPGERAILESSFGGPQPITIPAEGLTGNLAAGKASGVLAQWPISPGDDGHFVVFDQPKAFDQAAEFLKNLAADPKGRVPAP